MAIFICIFLVTGFRGFNIKRIINLLTFIIYRLCYLCVFQFSVHNSDNSFFEFGVFFLYHLLWKMSFLLFWNSIDAIYISLRVRVKWTCNISGLPDDAIASLSWGQSLSSRILTWSIRYSRSVAVFGPQTTHRHIWPIFIIAILIIFAILTPANSRNNLYFSVNCEVSRSWYFECMCYVWANFDYIFKHS